LNQNKRIANLILANGYLNEFPSNSMCLINYYKVRIKLYSIFITVLLVIFSYNFLFKVTLYSNKNQSNVISYSDKEDSGNSDIQIKNNKNSITVNYQLKKGHLYPYCGVVFRNIDKTPFYLSSKNLNYITINLKVKKQQKIILIFNQFDENQNKNILHLQTTLDCYPDQKTYKIPISQFVCPDWWYKLNQNLKNTVGDVDKINTLSIQSDSTVDTDIPQEFELINIDFKRDTTWILIFIISSIVLIGIIEVYIRIINKKKKTITIQYVPIEQTNSNIVTPWEKIEHYIGNKYKQDLDLQEVFLETGIPKHQISTLIKEHTGLSFPQFINTLRINEAERLLKETSMSIIQVSLEVGFQNVTHFNRTFKKLKNQNPTEYKQFVKE